MIRVLKDDADAAVYAAEAIEAALARRYPESMPEGGLSLNTMAIMAAHLVEMQFDDEAIEAEFTTVIPLEIEGQGESKDA